MTVISFLKLQIMNVPPILFNFLKFTFYFSFVKHYLLACFNYIALFELYIIHLQCELVKQKTNLTNTITLNRSNNKTPQMPL